MIPRKNVQAVMFAKLKKLLLLGAAVGVANVGVGCKSTPSKSAEERKTADEAETKSTEESDSYANNSPEAKSAPKSYKYKMGASDAPDVDPATIKEPKLGEKIELSDAEWKKRLTPEQYHIMRESGTERAWTGPLNVVKQKDGMFHCAACNAPLFRADTKFESGSGWPSFYDAVKGRVKLVSDHSFGMERSEVVCASCGAHLGHVFEDGPAPTGLRYCINSAALNFSEKGEPGTVNEHEHEDHGAH